VIKYQAVFPPFDHEFISSLHELGTKVFGEIDREDYFAFPLEKMPDASVQIAQDDGLVGFKFGYAQTSKRYYSALGCVHPDHRRRGVALRLLQEQHAWLETRGYQTIETGAVDSNEAMIALNLSVGFRKFGTYCRSDEPRVLMIKEL
jgi:predicted GNAT superfamily acetyltransferase